MEGRQNGWLDHDCDAHLRRCPDRRHRRRARADELPPVGCGRSTASSRGLTRLHGSGEPGTSLDTASSTGGAGTAFRRQASTARPATKITPTPAIAAIQPQSTPSDCSPSGPGTTVRVAGQSTVAPLGYSSRVFSVTGPGGADTSTSSRNVSTVRCASGPPRQVAVEPSSVAVQPAVGCARTMRKSAGTLTVTPDIGSGRSFGTAKLIVVTAPVARNCGTGTTWAEAGARRDEGGHERDWWKSPGEAHTTVVRRGRRVGWSRPRGDFSPSPRSR